MTTRTPLDAGWTLRAVEAGPDVPAAVAGAVLPAAVPGCVHTDLMAAGLLDDPYLDRNEDHQHWVGRTRWRYRSTVALAADRLGAGRHELHFAGLDTVAEIRLNGRPVGRTANMHRRYVFDVTDLVVAGDNELLVEFDPVRTYTDAMRDRFGDLPAAYDQPFQYVRKMAANFGWDWGPTLVTAGIWKPVELVTVEAARLAPVLPLVTVEDLTGRVSAQVAVVRAEGCTGPLTVTVAVDDHQRTVELPAGADTVPVALTVPQVRLWWPVGMGDQPRYDLTVRLADPVTGAELDRWQARIGFRRVELDTRPDDAGTPFVIRVNDVPVAVRGVNWIPDDCFVSRVDRPRYRRRLTQALDANVNLIRVWGGGIYETDDFYDLCDESGLLVWQDFLFACAAYPEGEPIRSEVLAEARDNVTRLAPHPSLVLWNGNNENIWGFQDWSWQEPLAGRPWGLGYYTELLPALVAELDPTRPYWPGSPYSGSADVHPNDPAHGTMHVWDVWNQRDYSAYAGYQPRFVAEFGFQGPPARSTMDRATSDPTLGWDTAASTNRQRAESGQRKILDGLRPHLPAIPSGDPRRATADWHYLAQLNQARAVEFGIGHFRALWPHCAGTILWQLNDCWPVVSWAMVDGDERRKPSWYAVRRAYAPRLLTVTGATGRRPVVHLVNNSPDPWRTALRVQLHDLDGDLLGGLDQPVELAPAGRYSLPFEVPAAALLLTAHADGPPVRRLLAEDVAVDLPPARLRICPADLPDGSGVALTVEAQTLLRDLVVLADLIDPAAVVDEQMITLLPGERHVFTIHTDVPAADPGWAAPGVVRCVNDLSKGDR
ncbi:glycoside hydrolase family 2 protein [Plantactinospora siamensis]|uniref:beta-mannosidase n=1 Tax=Plantactinospora siamensis TaxID=555372 RepID=A0ABV6P3J5_9ACTN